MEVSSTDSTMSYMMREGVNPWMQNHEYRGNANVESQLCYIEFLTTRKVGAHNSYVGKRSTESHPGQSDY